MCAPDAPDPPDPKETSAAQTGTSVGTAIANTMLGNVNQNGPNGSLRYNRTGSYAWTDPYTGQTYNIPQFTARTQLTPMGKAINQQTQGAKLNLATMAKQQSARMGEHLSQPFQPNQGAPRLQADMNLNTNLQQGKVNLQDDFGPADGYQNQVRRVERAMMDRLNPHIERDRQSMEASLANQGIALGGRAYSAAQDDMSRSVNDARTGILLAAGQEQSRLAGLDLARGQFRNDARLGEAGFNNQSNLTQAGFNNNAKLQGAQFTNDARLGERGFNNQSNLAQAGFNNNAKLQRGQFRNDARGQYLDEAYAQRNQPINEITALMSGSQVQMPNFGMNQPSTIPTTDVAGNIWNHYGAQQRNYQSELAGWNNIMGGIGSIFGAGFGMM